MIGLAIGERAEGLVFLVRTGAAWPERTGRIVRTTARRAATGKAAR